MIVLRQNAPNRSQPGYADAVGLWQQFLISRGLGRPTVNGVTEQLVADRDFGSITAQATIAFQAASSLDTDGVVGDGTYKAAMAVGFVPGPDLPAPGGDSLEAQKALLRAALDEFGITDPLERAGIAAINLGESGMKPSTEGSYRNTSNARIRSIFKTRTATVSEDDLTRIKADDVEFFELVYGGMLGNNQPGDGFRYRGRGLNQLTGRGNYDRYGKLLKDTDLVGNPELANDPAVAARISVVYMKDRIKPESDWDAMKRAVGNAVASTEAVKDQAFAQFQASGEFA